MLRFFIDLEDRFARSCIAIELFVKRYHTEPNMPWVSRKVRESTSGVQPSGTRRTTAIALAKALACQYTTITKDRDRDC